MKIRIVNNGKEDWKEIAIFEPENEQKLYGLACRYFELKGKLTRGEIKMPVMEPSYCKLLKELGYDIPVKEMVELRDYFDNYYADSIQEKIDLDFGQGMGVMDLKKWGIKN